MRFSAVPTAYDGVQFRSRLEARWAAFFDLCGWKWEYEPVELDGWIPDFYVRFPCRHSECTGFHELHIEVKPFRDIKEFQGHPAYALHETLEAWHAPHPALFGINPEITEWQGPHGAGGGYYDIPVWVPHWRAVWKRAGNLTQWNKGTCDMTALSTRPRSTPKP